MTYFRWSDWRSLRANDNLSILDVVNFGTVDFKLAGLLWLLMEQRASVLVAAGPSFVGKTTLLHTLLDFLPPDIHQVALRGYDEDFKSLGSSQPDKTYLVTEEISNHSYEYLWGYQVIKAFELLSKGYALGGTVHGRNVKEVAYVLNALGVPLPLIGKLDAVITLRVTSGRSYDDEPVRRVDTVSILSLTKEGLVAQTVAARQATDDGFAYPPEQALHSALASKLAIKYGCVASEMERRERFLGQLRDRGIGSRNEVKKAIAEFY
ncbi:MAG: hypothetical protein A2Z15_05785 [Chloroflexi bacterium RBG_16_50_11]|nr:MAG: hypothetical protein A2Z15_05785 [Chloroflexi bacterium RBG_16_50_11]